ncbi:MAG: ABC transporter ATP-binding protein [Clostridiales bacterium]|nr:ABC transporter ATP-binding protein [Clostridiales bacterium]
MGELVLEMRNILKRFTGVVANHDVNLKLYAGEIHALLGENGAGKSTLMNILTGIYKPNEGEIFYKGKKVTIKSPKHAVNMGIGMVHQHFRLIPTLTVTENVFLNSENCKFFMKMKDMEEEVRKCSQKFNLEVDPTAKVWQLSVGEQQRVEIVKLLYRGAEILILDEPSAVLTPQESDEMFKTLRKMADSGKVIVFISHKMNEVMANADRITILRGGTSVATMKTSETTREELTQLMVGREIKKQSRENRKARGECVIKVENLCANNDKGLRAVDEVTMELYAGEIFGIAGVAGNGQRELTETLAGLRKATGGRILAKGEDITASSAKNRIRKGISFVPEDRLHMGLVPSMNMMENAILKQYDTPTYSGKGILNKKAIREHTEAFVKEHDIKNAGLQMPVSLMSGGNQQKLLIAREVSGEPSLIIAAYPVRGLDIGATEAIHKILMQQRERGAAILLVSEDLDEIFEMADRVGVMYSGKMMGILDVNKTDYVEIGKLMVGMTSEDSAKEA